ncbi:MAG: hypothetical protein IBX68_08245, partial [Dehalococcoidia bacterium]|nr:hypothetical protein [Dehalococcoidia bacterium]
MRRVLIAALALLVLGAVAGGSIAWAKTANGNPDGGLNEVSLDESRTIAEDYLLNGPTYKFDGIEGSVFLTDTTIGESPHCWTFVF